MSAFLRGMDGLTIGENGALEHTAVGVGENRVALFFALVRNIPDDRLESLMTNCLKENDSATLADLFVLAFQTRDCRGGKGERSLSYKMIMFLYKSFPETVLELLPLLSEFGYFKDYFKILETLDDSTSFEPLRNKIINIVATQLRKDEEILNNTTEGAVKISLCAKYAPREGKKLASNSMKSSFKYLRNKLFPDYPEKNKVLYRKLIARLTQALDVPEVKMCGKRYREIAFEKVPSVCANKNRKAFLNEKLKVNPTREEDLTGNRFPTDEDRVLCRANMRAAIVSKKVGGKQLYPHEVVKQLMQGNSSTLEKDLSNVQWGSLRQQVLDKMLEQQEKEKEKGDPAMNTTASSVSVGKLVPLVDVSGSMSGIPMEVAIALGILISEINHPSFRDRLLTFSANPTWVNLSKCADISEKVELTQRAEWGMNTDINKAFDLILSVAKENKLPPAEVPDLIIFSDMQFDSALKGGSPTTQLKEIQKKFAALGYSTPKVIFWNLRGDTVGFPAQGYEGNVQMLSGYSPSLLKFVMEGEELDLSAGAEGNGVKNQVNPYDTLRKVLDDERYDSLRKILNNSTEGILNDYKFEPVSVDMEVK